MDALLMRCRGESGGTYAPSTTTTGSTKCSWRWRRHAIPGHPILQSFPTTATYVEHREVLHELAQPHPAGVGADRHAELLGAIEVAPAMISFDARQADSRVELALVDRLRLEELLEEHAVHAVLARGHPTGRHRAAHRGVPEDVVGARRLLDPVAARTRRAPSPSRWRPEHPTPGWRRS